MAKVNLHIENKAGVEVELRAYAEHPKKAPEEVALGNLVVDEERAKTGIHVPGEGTIALKAFHLGQQVFQWRHSVSRLEETFVVAVVLQKGQQIQDPDDALSVINSVFGKLGEGQGLGPIGVENALMTTLGALVVMNEDGSTSYELSPQEFSSVVSYEDFKYFQAESSKHVEVTGEVGTSFGAALGVLAKMGLDVTGSGIYRVVWDMRGFGPFKKPEAPGWSLVGALTKLPLEQTNAYETALKNNPKSRLIYVNKIFAIETAAFSVLRASKNQGKFDFGSNFFNGSAFWTFENSFQEVKSLKEVVINASGVDVTPRDRTKSLLDELTRRSAADGAAVSAELPEVFLDQRSVGTLARSRS